MDKIIGVTELQHRFRAVFDEVVRKHTPYILTRGSRPEAVLISYEHYQRYLRADETGVLKRIDDALAYMARVNAQHSDEEIESDLKEATRIVRSRKARV